jgi:squalene-hopene/tetraprenyl-beta-curcumene cyclase
MSGVDIDKLDQAIDKALDWLDKQQEPAGNWNGKISSETVVTAWISYALWLWGQPEAQRGLDWLVSNQNPDGGWGGDLGQPSYFDATHIAMTVLQACSHMEADSQTVCRGREYLARNPGKIHSLGGLLEASVVADFGNLTSPMPRISLKPAAYLGTLFPRVSRRRLRHMYETLYAIALGFASQANGLLDRSVKHRATRLLESLWDLQGRWILPGPSLVALRKFGDSPNMTVVDKALTWASEFQNEDGGWGWCPEGQFLNTPLAVVALLEAGVPRDSELIRKAVTWIKDQWAIEGAWGANCAAPPDADDTGIALLALIQAGESLNCHFVRQAVWYLKKSQQTNGAWGYPVSTNHGEIAGVALQALLAAGEPCDSRSVRKGMKWMFNHQLPDGSWSVRWYVHELIASHRVVSALRTAGYPKSGGVLRYASRYVLSRRQSNGGFGGVENTAYAILALLDLEEVEHLAIQEGVNWLIQQQNPEGGWTTGYCGFFGDRGEGSWVCYYRDQGITNSYSLWALSRYRRCLSQDAQHP